MVRPNYGGPEGQRGAAEGNTEKRHKTKHVIAQTTRKNMTLGEENHSGQKK